MAKETENGFVIPDYDDNTDIPTLIRQNADAAEAIIAATDEEQKGLEKRINDEAATRETADNALGKRIDDEAQTRKAADTALGERIDEIQLTPGPQGEQGIPGKDGAAGAPGKDGAAGTIEITEVITGEPGTAAKVENTGTANAAKLKITIPKGATGAPGANGTNGINGSNGKDGAAATITVGTVTTGEAGSAANVENVGTDNAARLNFKIPRGATGATGAQGATGATGASGTSAAWHTGTSISGTGTHTFSVSGAHAGDMYLNTSTGDVYEATSATSWTWKCNIKGPTGSQGPQGPAGTTAARLTTPRTIDGVNFDGSGAITHYGVCSTAGDTAAKTVSIPGFKLVEGAVVFVKFTNKNTVNVPTLNVNGTGAASMRSQGGTVLNKSEISSNILYMFVYDGTDYQLVGALNHSGSSSVVIGKGESEYSNTTVVGGEQNYAGGYSSTIIGGMGNRTLAYQTKIGFYSTEGTDSDYFVVGNGSIMGSSRSNAFRVDSSGKVYGKGSFNTSGADYAELFEWLDGNPENEDRIGLFVTLDGEKIRLANADDDYILGAISGAPGVVGNNHADTWQGMWLTDIYGRVQKHTVHVDAKYDDEGNVICEAHDVVEPIVNPDYNADEKYVPREDRPEWGIVGMMGQLIVIDDGTCEVNGCCKVADGGKATASENGYRVIARIDDTHVKVLFR